MTDKQVKFWLDAISVMQLVRNSAASSPIRDGVKAISAESFREMERVLGVYARGEHNLDASIGMALAGVRDRFAAAALSGIVTVPASDEWTHEGDAKFAWAAADAMMKMRPKK